MLGGLLRFDDTVHPHGLAALNGLDRRHQHPHALQAQVIALEPVVALEVSVIDEVGSLGLRRQIQRDALVDVAVKDDLALVQHDAAVAQVADRRHIVADVEHGLAVALGGLAHLRQALFLEFHVADGQHLVHDHDFAVKVRGDGERQFNEHTAGIALDRGIDEVADLGKFDDLSHLGVDLAAGHAQDRAVQVDVLAAGHFGMEAGTDLQHRRHASVQVDVARRGRGNMGQQLEQRGLARTVRADDADGLALVDGEADAVQRHKRRADEALVGTDQCVRVFLAALARPPALQVAAQRAAADLAEPVLFFDILDADHQFVFTHNARPLTPYRRRSFRPC